MPYLINEQSEYIAPKTMFEQSIINTRKHIFKTTINLPHLQFHLTIQNLLGWAIEHISIEPDHVDENHEEGDRKHAEEPEDVF